MVQVTKLSTEYNFIWIQNNNLT